MMSLIQQFGGTQIQPNTQQKSWSIRKVNPKVSCQYAVRDPSKAIAKHKGPWSRIQGSQMTALYGSFGVFVGCREHEIGHEASQAGTNVFEDDRFGVCHD
jgi:hypothetical protein